MALVNRNYYLNKLNWGPAERPLIEMSSRKISLAKISKEILSKDLKSNIHYLIILKNCETSFENFSKFLDLFEHAATKESRLPTKSLAKWWIASKASQLTII